jgi:carbon monoxide dehydrogenase subunit G
MSLKLLGECHIPASVEDTWNALNNPEILKICIPGCKHIEQNSPHEFTAIVEAKVGPIAVTFRGNVVLQDLDPPYSYVLVGQGQGGAAGFAKLTARVSLARDGEQTLLKYDADTDIGGKLASIGGRLIQSIAKKNVDDFFGKFSAVLGGDIEQDTPNAIERSAGGDVSRHALSFLDSLAQPIPAWLAVFTCVIGIGLGYAMSKF